MSTFVQDAIQATLERYGVWNGSLEREHIRSQQRKPEPSPRAMMPRPAYTVSDLVARTLSHSDQWWTLGGLAAYLGTSENAVGHPIRALIAAGKVEKERRERGCRNRPQLYRWRQR